MASVCSLAYANERLSGNHYLGPVKHARLCVAADSDVLVFAAPRSRNIPVAWLELVRWCILSGPGSGSRQWPAVVEEVRKTLPATTTLVSYSDPSAGHDGALYRACNWLWAPTWHRLRPPPSGNGNWGTDRVQSVKDRWVYPLIRDDNRAEVLALRDAALERRKPWAVYREPTWRGSRFNPATGGADFKQWKQEKEHATQDQD